MQNLAKTSTAILCLLLSLNFACKTANKEMATSTPVTNKDDAPSVMPAVSPIAQPEESQTTKFPPRRTFNHKFKIVSQYDKFEDSTFVRSDYMPVGNGISIVSGFSYNGKKIDTPPTMTYFEIGSKSDDWRFEEYRELIILADGEKIEVGKMMFADRDIRSGNYLEYLSIPMFINDFLKVINAKKVEMKVGTEEFALKENHLEAMRDLASRMTP